MKKMGSRAAAAGSESWADAPHVVVVPCASSGHTIPFLQLARRLASTGIVTTVVTSDKHHLELQASLGTTDFTPQGQPLRILGLGDKESLGLSHKDWRDRVRRVRSDELRVIHLLECAIKDLSSPESLTLCGLHQAAPPVCVLHDMFESWAQEVAENLQIAKHLLYVSPAAALSCALQSNRLYQQGIVPIRRETRELILYDIPGLPPFSVLNLPSPFLSAQVYAWMRERHQSFRNADIILLNTFYDIEKPVLDALRNEVIGSPGLLVKCILDIGPLLPDCYVNDDGNDDVSEQEEIDPCMLWLNTQSLNSVLYVSFGSGATHSAEQLVELALGLEASGVSFLWIVRPPSAPTDFSAASAAESITDFLPVGFEERVRGRGMCYSGWAPQMRILKHPTVGGFLSHCGWNSILETVCAGVPVLAWPIFAEQHLNRRFVSIPLQLLIVSVAVDV